MLPTIKLSYAVLKMVIFSIGMAVLGSSVVGCAQKTVNDHGGEKKMTARTIEEVLKEHTNKWMSIPGVVGTGIGKVNDKLCIKVFVVKKTEELTKKIPSQIEGFLVVIEETGEIRALDASSVGK